MTAGAVQPEWSSWSPLAPTEGPYYGVNDGQVVIRALGTRAVLDRGEIVRRNTFTLVLRSAITGQCAGYPLLRVRVEPLPSPASPRARRARREGDAGTVSGPGGTPATRPKRP